MTRDEYANEQFESWKNSCYLEGLDFNTPNFKVSICLDPSTKDVIKENYIGEIIYFKNKETDETRYCLSLFREGNTAFLTLIPVVCLFSISTTRN